MSGLPTNARLPTNAKLLSNDFEDSALLVQRVEVREVISQMFEINVVAMCTSGEAPNLEDLAGAEITLAFETREKTVKQFYGMVAQVRALDGGQTRHPVLTLKIVPLAWMSSMVETLDIYLDQSIPQLIEGKLQLLDLAIGSDFEMRLGSYPKREFVVQYQESDLRFISRLAEHYGICFFFEHSDSESRLVFSDEMSGHKPIVGSGKVAYRQRGDHIDVYRLEQELNLIPGMYVCRDYNYRSPAVELMANHRLDEGFGGGIIDYGAHCKNPEEAARIAQLRAEERLATRDVFVGDSSCVDFHPGATVTIEDYPRMTDPLLLTEVVHRFIQPTGVGAASTDVGYRNTFRAVPATRSFRPPRITPKPKIPGLLTGIIESHQGAVQRRAKLDEEGRYRVRFLFDTAPSGERQASKQVRQIQPSAGPGYGIHFPLKPGVEVALAFVNGDPDRPLIVGAIPNPITPSPVTRKHASANRIRTESGVLVEIEDGWVQ